MYDIVLIAVSPSEPGLATLYLVP